MVLSVQSVEALLGQVRERNSGRGRDPPSERTNRENVCKDEAGKERCDGDQDDDGNFVHHLKDIRQLLRRSVPDQTLGRSWKDREFDRRAIRTKGDAGCLGERPVTMSGGL